MRETMQVAVSFAVALAVLAWVAVYPPGGGATSGNRSAVTQTTPTSHTSGGGPATTKGGAGAVQVGCGG